MRVRRFFTEEFKIDAVELSFNSDKTIEEIADDLGINYGNLTRWRREYRNKNENVFPGNGNQLLNNRKSKSLKMSLKKLNWNAIY